MIKVTAADIDRFLAENDDQPIVMLNLRGLPYFRQTDGHSAEALPGVSIAAR